MKTPFCYLLGRYNIPPCESLPLNLEHTSQNKTDANLPSLLLCHGPSIRKENRHALQIHRFNYIIKTNSSELHLLSAS